MQKKKKKKSLAIIKYDKAILKLFINIHEHRNLVYQGTY